jgi:heme exporter protein B
LREVIDLIKKDFLLEIRQRYALNAILLYVVSTVFVVQLSFGRIIDETVGLHCFGSYFCLQLSMQLVKALCRSIPPDAYIILCFSLTVSIIISKITYNSLLMVSLGFLSFGLYVLFLGLPEFNPWLLYPIIHTRLYWS